MFSGPSAGVSREAGRGLCHSPSVQRQPSFSLGFVPLHPAILAAQTSCEGEPGTLPALGTVLLVMMSFKLGIK